MKRSIVYSAAVALSLGLCSLGLSGCGESAESEKTTPSVTDEGSGDKDHSNGDHSHGDSDHEDGDDLSDMEKMKATLAKLSTEDAASAMKQHFCPVSGGMLGVMDAPLKVDVNGQQVWICCEDCRNPLLENPDEYLAKLKTE